MEALRWRASDKRLIGTSDADELAIDIALEIRSGRYDGYRCVNQYLTKAVTYYLAAYTEQTKWAIMTDVRTDGEPEYLVWVMRQ